MISLLDAKRLQEEAKKVLYGNMKSGVSSWGKEFFYICPSQKHYPHQWLWDSCFHAIVMRHFDVNIAKRELLTLLSCAQENGLLPHTIYWQKPSLPTRLVNKLLWGSTKCSQLTQPPVVAIALEKVYQKDKDKEFLTKTLPAVKSYYLWLSRERNPYGNGLVVCIHPFESRDEAPEFDYVFGLKKPHAWELYYHILNTLLDIKKHDFSANKIARDSPNGFLVFDVFFNSIYAQGLASIHRLCKEIGDRDEEKFKSLWLSVEKAIISLCYNKRDKTYYSLWQKDQKQLPILAVSSLFPLILDTIPHSQVQELVEKHLLNPNEFWLPYPIPCVPKNNPCFTSSSPLFLWRGSTWININWFLIQGLIKHGYQDIAKEIALKTQRMVLENGFREFYNPFTGKGLRSKNYGWSTLIVDILKDEVY